MTARPILPGGDRPLIEPEGGDDGLHRTAVAEQGDHDGHQVDGFLEAVERRVARGGESLAAGEASVTTLLPAMHADVAESELSACGAIGVVAELSERVHRYPSRGTVWRPCPEGCSVDPCFSRGYPPHHGSMGCYPLTNASCLSDIQSPTGVPKDWAHSLAFRIRRRTSSSVAESNGSANQTRFRVNSRTT